MGWLKLQQEYGFSHEKTKNLKEVVCYGRI